MLYIYYSLILLSGLLFDLKIMMHFLKLILTIFKKVTSKIIKSMISASYLRYRFDPDEREIRKLNY